ncbi:MAG: radical SAM protein [Nitrospirae bacterium]|nr:radical SAM protein [Nitrospirota bacterium]
MDIKLKPGSKILLIEPPFYRFFNYERWHYPVTLINVGTYIEKMGYEVLIYDADKPTKDCRSLQRTEIRNNYRNYKPSVRDENHPIWEEVMRTVRHHKPDAVGLTSITPQIYSANMIARKIKQEFGSDITVFLGGSHVDGMWWHEPDYDYSPLYDFVIIKDNSTLKKIFKLKPNKNLAMNIGEYTSVNLSSILTSVGCPNKCTYCRHSFDRGFAFRDSDIVYEELLEIKDKYNGAHPVYIMDDTFLFYNAHFKKIAAMIKEMGHTFICGARVMDLTQEKIDIILDSGCIKLQVGIESGSQEILDKIEKKLKIEEIRRRTKWINDANLKWQAFFVTGFPFETSDDLKLTKDLVYEIEPTYVSLNRFAPFPGTKLYREYYLGSNIDFADIFQISEESCVKLSDEMELYIEQMYKDLDEYNMKKAAGMAVNK